MGDGATQLLRIEPAPAAAAGEAAWLSVEDAARRMSLSERRVRQLCGERWHSMGLARMERSGDGKRSVWVVCEKADPALGRVVFPEHIPADLHQFTAGQRETILRRKTILDGWEQALADAARGGMTIEAATKVYLSQLGDLDGAAVSRGTLYGWQKRYRASGLAGLADARANREECNPKADPFMAEVRRLWLHRNAPKLQTVVRWAEQIAADKKWAVRSYKQCRRMVEAIPAVEIARERGGAKTFTDAAEAYLERDYTGLASNEIWISDHHSCDVQVIGEGGELLRPWLTAWQDMRSRKIVGFLVYGTDPNSDSILLSFKSGVKEFGVPEIVYIDNGKDYDAYGLQGKTKQQRRRVRVDVNEKQVDGAFQAVGVKRVIHCEIYHGQSKPIERFFGTMEMQFGKRWESYCGRSPQHKPEGLPEAIKRGAAPTLAEFAAALGTWIEKEYNAQPHTGQGMDGKTPDQVYLECLRSKRTASMELLELLSMKVTQPTKVGQNGVRHGGLNYGRYSPALTAMLGKEVYLRVDPANINAVSVWTMEDQFLCWAKVNEMIPANASSEQLREAMREKRSNRKAVQEYRKRAPRMHEPVAETMARLAAEKKAAQIQLPPDAAPPSIQPVRSPLEDQLKHVQQGRKVAMGQRVAVGAEGLDLIAAAEQLEVQMPRSFQYRGNLLDAMADGDGQDGEFVSQRFVYKRPEETERSHSQEPGTDDVARAGQGQEVQP